MAKKLLHKVIQIQPNHAPAYNNLGNVLIRGLDNGNQGKYFFYEGNPGIYMETGKNNLVFCFKPEENIDIPEESEGPADSGLSSELLNLKANLVISASI